MSERERERAKEGVGDSGEMFLHRAMIVLADSHDVMSVAHANIFCQKSFTKLFISFVKISCVVHGKTVCKIV